MNQLDLTTLRTRPVVVLDTETTGFYFDRDDEIIELAAEKLLGNDVVDRFHALIRSNKPVPLEVTAIHGLSDDYIQSNGLPHRDVFQSFAEFIVGSVLVGHNIRRFDFPFLAAHYNRLNLPVPSNELVDTLDLSRSMLQLPNHKLGTIASHYGFSTEGAHRAMADVVMTRQILLELLPKN